MYDNQNLYWISAFVLLIFVLLFTFLIYVQYTATIPIYNLTKTKDALKNRYYICWIFILNLSKHIEDTLVLKSF